MRKLLSGICLLSILIAGCIGDDFVDDRVDPVLRITNPIDSIAIDSSYTFELMYLNNVGMEESIEAEWTSSDPNIISISSNGVASAIGAGSAEITVEYSDEEGTISDSNVIGVGERTVVEESEGKHGSVATTTFYTLQGDFTLTPNDDSGVVLAFGDDYEASTALPGLYVYLSNNPNTISGAREIQAVEVFEGAHSYEIPDVGLEDYGYVLYFCKPFNVKVGHGQIED